MMARALEALHPGLTVELVGIVTTGDVVTGDLAKLGGKGLFRLDLEDLPAHPLAADVLLPAPCQGTLALEVRTGGPAERFCAALDHAATARAATAERRVVAAFGGDCTLPLAAWARSEGAD